MTPELATTPPEPAGLMSLVDFSKLYSEKAGGYKELSTALQDALKRFLKGKGIAFLDVTTRVKDLDSAYKKSIKKGYTQPLNDIQDWCGLRVICYYSSDIVRICDLIREEFQIWSYEDTAERLMPDAFGYRSIHFIISIKDSWTQGATYRTLGGLVAEVQVRTIMMHAWAEIEHKLKYKSAVDVPKQLQRQLYRLSAKFEESDEQFESIRAGIENYREELSNQKSSIDDFVDSDLNLEILGTFINLALPMPPYSIHSWFGKTEDALLKITEAKMTMTEVVAAFKVGKQAGESAALKFQQSFGSAEIKSQIDVLHFALAAGSDKYYQKNIAEGAPTGKGFFARNIYNFANSARAEVQEGIRNGSIII